MDSWLIGVQVATLVVIILVVAFFIVRVTGRQRIVPSQLRSARVGTAITLIVAGIVLILTRARYLGNWWWGFFALGCILMGCAVFWGSRHRVPEDGERSRNGRRA